MYQLYKSLSESVQPIPDSPVEVLTLCPCPPETSEHIPDTDKAEVDGDSFFSEPKCQCGHPWVIGDFICSHCSFKSDIPF